MKKLRETLTKLVAEFAREYTKAYTTELAKRTSQLFSKGSPENRGKKVLKSKESVLEEKRSYYWNNRERELARQAIYRAQPHVRERRRQHMKEYTAKNREAIRARARARYHENPAVRAKILSDARKPHAMEHKRQYMREYYAKNREHLRETARARHRERRKHQMAYMTDAEWSETMK